MRPAFNRTTAPMVIKFYDICFKQGVIDAYEQNDELSTKDFLESRLEDWHLATLEHPEDDKWQNFLFALYWWARKRHMTYFAEKFIFNLKVKCGEWAFLPYCLRFYLMGIKEWLDYPNPVDIEVFKTKSRIHWDPNVGIKQFTNGDYFSYMHDFAFDYRTLPKEQQITSAFSLDEFCRAVFALTREARKRKKYGKNFKAGS